jgi:hypothetical protein
VKQDDPHDERAQELARDHHFQTPSVKEVTAERPASGASAHPAAPDPSPLDRHQARPADDGADGAHEPEAA